METENLDEPPNLTTTTPVATLTAAQHPDAQSPTTNDNNDDVDPAVDPFYEDVDYIDSNCSTPFVSAPSSPGRTTFLPSSGGGGYFYSAPASPMHFLLSNAAANSARSSGYVPSPSESSLTAGGSFEFEFSARFTSSSNSNTNDQRCNEIPAEVGSMSSADELFLNGQIRPMKLSSHLQRPQFLAPLIDVAESEGDEFGTNEHGEAVQNNDENGDAFTRSRTYWRLRDKSLRRRARSMSPMRNNNDNAALFDWCEPANVDAAARVEEEDQNGKLKLDEVAEMMLKAQQGSAGEGRKELEGTEVSAETTPSSASASSSRCSSAGRSSKRWVFLKDFLRSKSEGRNNVKFWSNISFSPIKEKKGSSISSQQGQQPSPPASTDSKEKGDQTSTSGVTSSAETQKPPKNKATKKSSTPPPTNGIRMGKRRVPLSAHEMHYTANRAQAEEMRKKTYLPYRQGLLGCLGFSSKSYGAMNGFARALNPVSSR